MPYLSLSISTDFHQGHFTVSLQNKGIGPAIIESRKIFYNGQTYDLDFVDFLGQETNLLDSFDIMSTTIERGTAIATQEVLVLLEVHAGEQLPEFVKDIEGMQIDKGLDYSICYRSIYEEGWCFSGDSDVPEPF